MYTDVFDSNTDLLIYSRVVGIYLWNSEYYLLILLPTPPNNHPPLIRPFIIQHFIVYFKYRKHKIYRQQIHIDLSSTDSTSVQPPSYAYTLDWTKTITFFAELELIVNIFIIFFLVRSWKYPFRGHFWFRQFLVESCRSTKIFLMSNPCFSH